MKIETLKQIVEKLEKISKRGQELYKSDVDLINYDDDFYTVIDLLLKEVFSVEAHDWFDWYCYENNFGKGDLEAFNKNGNRICRNIEELFELINE